LPENLPLLIEHKASALPDEIHQKLNAAKSSEKTGWFDTHPCDADRVQHARRLNQPGVFRLTEPATQLFSDFAALSKTVTRHQYEKHLELTFTDENLMPAEEILRESAASAEADAMVRKYYGNVNVTLLPLLLTGDLPPLFPGESAISTAEKAQQEMDRLREEAEKLSAECVEQRSKLVNATVALCLASAGFKIHPKEFGLPESATSAADAEVAARSAIEEITGAVSDRLARLEPFMAALRQRVTAGLRLARGRQAVPGAETAASIEALARLLAAVGAEMPRAHQLAVQVSAFSLLAQNRGNHSRPAEVEKNMNELAAALQSLIAGIQERLKDFPYPFSHARGSISVAEYARSEEPATNEWHRTHLDSHAHVERIFALNRRLIGRILALADGALNHGKQ
jgi:hypothetical protein